MGKIKKFILLKWVYYPNILKSFIDFGEPQSGTPVLFISGEPPLSAKWIGFRVGISGRTVCSFKQTGYSFSYSWNKFIQVHLSGFDTLTLKYLNNFACYCIIMFAYFILFKVKYVVHSVIRHMCSTDNWADHYSSPKFVCTWAFAIITNLHSFMQTRFWGSIWCKPSVFIRWSME